MLPPLGCQGWIFSDGSTCPREATVLYATSLLAWSLLLVLNLPCLLACAMPCLLACKCDCAFGIVAALSGIHRRPDRASDLI